MLQEIALTIIKYFEPRLTKLWVTKELSVRKKDSS